MGFVMQRYRSTAASNNEPNVRISEYSNIHIYNMYMNLPMLDDVTLGTCGMKYKDKDNVKVKGFPTLILRTNQYSSSTILGARTIYAPPRVNWLSGSNRFSRASYPVL